MKKKIVSLLMVMAMSVTMLAGCGAKEEAAEAPAAEAAVEEAAPVAEDSADAAPAAKEAVTIWYYWETEGHQVALDQIIQEYNGSQDAYEVTAKYVPFADFKKQLSIGASADELPDLAILDSPDHASYASMGIFEDITGKFDVSNYYEGTVNSCTIDGKLYGVPFGVNCLALYYNEDMLNAAGCSVPTTWAELEETAQKLTTDTVTGLALCSVQNEEGSRTHYTGLPVTSSALLIPGVMVVDIFTKRSFVRFYSVGLLLLAAAFLCKAKIKKLYLHGLLVLAFIGSVIFFLIFRYGGAIICLPISTAAI